MQPKVIWDHHIGAKSWSRSLWTRDSMIICCKVRSIYCFGGYMRRDKRYKPCSLKLCMLPRYFGWWRRILSLYGPTIRLSSAWNRKLRFGNDRYLFVLTYTPTLLFPPEARRWCFIASSGKRCILTNKSMRWFYNSANHVRIKRKRLQWQKGKKNLS